MATWAAAIGGRGLRFSMLLDEGFEGFLQGHRGDGEFRDLIGGEFKDFEVGHGYGQMSVIRFTKPGSTRRIRFEARWPLSSPYESSY